MATGVTSLRAGLMRTLAAAAGVIDAGLDHRYRYNRSRITDHFSLLTDQ